MVIFMGFFTPGWLNNNKEKRLRAVAKITSQEKLLKIVKNTYAFEDVRVAAAKKITNKSLFFDLFTSFLKDISSHSYDLLKYLLNEINDQAAYAEIALNPLYGSWKIDAAKLINDPNVKRDAIDKSRDWEIRSFLYNSLGDAEMKNYETALYSTNGNEIDAAIEYFKDPQRLINIAENAKSEYAVRSSLKRLRQTEETFIDYVTTTRNVHIPPIVAYMCEAQNEIELILSATSNPLLISCLEKREAELREKRVQENSKALLQACKANEKFETITRIVNDGVSCIDITEDIKTQLEAAWGNDAVRIITVTPLYYAIIRGDQTIVDYLLEQGASISACKEIESHTYDTGSIHDWPKTETREAQLDLEKLAAKYGVSLPKKNK